MDSISISHSPTTSAAIFFFNDTATTEIYTLSLHDALPIWSTYHKVLDREAWTHAVVSAAVVLEMDRGICRSARIVLGGVAPIPWRLPEVEALLDRKSTRLNSSH